MHVASPGRGGIPAARLGRELLEDLLEVPGTLSARVEAREKVNVGFQRLAIVCCRLVRELRHGRVEDLPRCVTKLRPIVWVRDRFLLLSKKLIKYVLESGILQFGRRRRP